MTIVEGQPRSAGRTATAVRSLSPGYFPFVMATSIISTGTFLLGPTWLSRVLLVIASAGLAVLSAALVIQLVLFRPSVAADFHDPGRVFGFFAIPAGMDVLGTWWIPLLVVLGFWRHIRRHWPLSYEPALWSVVFPLGMYSVATLTFGKIAHLAFMEPLSRFMLWVAMAAWVAVAAALVARIPARSRLAEKVNSR
jgi:tellurite resistance protein TehA-like permease